MNFYQNEGFYVWSWKEAEGTLAVGEGNRDGLPLNIEVAVVNTH